MTGNVAQVFIDDRDWDQTLREVRGCLNTDGWFVFESRRPEVRDWERWEVTPTRVDLPDGRTVVVSMRVTEVALPLVTFESETTIDGEVVRSASTLRFRERQEIERDLDEHGFAMVDVRDAPDRPGMEVVFRARRIDS
jgi:hypothetical protein